MSWSSIRCEKLVARAGRPDELVAALLREAEQLAECDMARRPQRK